MSETEEYREELTQELKEYLQNKYDDAMMEKMLENSVFFLAFKWMHHNGSAVDYYTDREVGELYLFDLVKYQGYIKEWGIMDAWLKLVEGVLPEDRPLKTLEYGGGIGQFSHMLCKRFVNKVDVDYWDLPGAIRDYAEIRSINNETVINFLVEDPLKKDTVYDIVNIMDVLEHVEEPQDIYTWLEDHARLLICNPDQIPYNSFFPQHITKVELPECFVNIGANVYKNTNFTI